MPPDEIYANATYLLKKGEKAQARNLLQQALKVNPKDERAWILYIETLSTDEERIRALGWCLKFNPDSDVAKVALAELQLQSFDQETQTSEKRIHEPDMTNPRPTKKLGRFILPIILALVIVMCIVPISLDAYLDTPLFAFGPKYRASTYEITDPAKAALAIENHSAYHIGSIVLTRHQDGKVYEFEGLPLEGEGIYSIEPGGYDLAVNYKSYEGQYAPTWELYVDSTATAHFNVRRTRAVVFHLEGGGSGSVPLSFVPPELEGK